VIDIKIVAVRRNQTSKRIYEAADYDLRLPGGKVVTWSRIEGPDIVVVLAVDDDGNALMKREWRLAQKKEVLELVSGRMEKGEKPLDCAARELKEEIGVEAKTLTSLGKISLWNHSAVHAHLFLATGLKVGANNPDTDEVIELEKVPYIKATKTAMKVGTNAQTLLALFLSQPHLAEKLPAGATKKVQARKQASKKKRG